MLVSYEWLRDHADDPDLMVVDSRSGVSYSYGHLKNSVRLGMEDVITTDKYGSNLAAPADSISAVLGRLGIDGQKTLVVTGDFMDPSAARILWTLQYMGHQKTALLRESFGQLRGLGAELTRERSCFAPAVFHAKPDPGIRIDAGPLKDSPSEFSLIDARSPQEFMHGHIPGATLIPFTDGIGQDGDMFLPKQKLEKLFAQKGVSDDRELVCYCMHGHRASSMFYQLKLAGFSRVRLYDGSFVQWYGMGLATE